MLSLKEKIFILDFGSQYTQLISRRIRELRVFSEIVPPTITFEEVLKLSPKGIILSGGPQSVTKNTISFDFRLLDASVPLLGICYGMHLMNTVGDGLLSCGERREYGKKRMRLMSAATLFKGLEKEEVVWMSHGDSIQKLSSCYRPLAMNEEGGIIAFEHVERLHYGVQFHPEVVHTQNGHKILENFLDVCGCAREWTVENYLEETKKTIREKVGNGKVVSLVSGGVDSTVATLVCFEALGTEKVYPLHIDTGLMRAGESLEVKKMLCEQEMQNLIFVDASNQFLEALKGVYDSEAKRKVIGELFIEVLEQEMEKLEESGRTTFFCQGTLYTDLIESGKGCGQHAAVIKSHHNVNPPLVEKKRKEGLILEPNAGIFKDEVRRLCEALNVSSQLVGRHPFPGPGLAIRVLGEVTVQRLKMLRMADQIYLEELRKKGLYEKIWQAFAVLLPVETVGVMGDQRMVGHVIALRAVTSVDGMTADFFSFPMDILGEVSTRIVNEVPGVTRVVYDVTSKPPATIEWE